MRCASVRKKGSDIQCHAKALFGHTLCGRHAKSKRPVLWSSTQQENVKCVVCIQRHVRGWLLRKRLSLAGPGVLNRKYVANDEDVNTMNEKAHPLNYFAFEENGKIWWFEINSIQRWIQMTMKPLNPYTKVPLTIQTRKRLRELISYQYRHKQYVHSEIEILPIWNLLCQCFEDYGFGEIQSRLFIRLNKYDYHAIFKMISSDLKVIMKDHDKLTALCDVTASKCFRMTSALYVFTAARMLLHLIYIPRDPYVLLFTILSALYRV